MAVALRPKQCGWGVLPTCTRMESVLKATSRRVVSVTCLGFGRQPIQDRAPALLVAAACATISTLPADALVLGGSGHGGVASSISHVAKEVSIQGKATNNLQTTEEDTFLRAAAGCPRYHATAFDRALQTFVNMADSLSLATGELLDLTAAAAAAAEASDEQMDMIYDAKHRTAVPNSRSSSVVSNLQGRFFGSKAHEQVVDALQVHAVVPDVAIGGQAGNSAEMALGVAQQISQQALSVASEALKLASLLDDQANQDPSYTTLLQQIEESARAVAKVAADIAEPSAATDQAEQAS